MVSSIRLQEFEKAVTRGSYTIDRTPYLEKYEKAGQNFVICLRPEGFDKRMFLSMIRTYYDTNLSRTSKKLFRKLYISNNISSSANSFYILYFDFSRIRDSGPAGYQASYRHEMEKALQEFKERYPQVSTESLVSNVDSGIPDRLLRRILKRFGDLDLFVLINEYEGFHHEILEDTEKKESLTGNRNPWINSIYSELKRAVNDKVVNRVFALGIDDSQDRIVKD